MESYGFGQHVSEIFPNLYLGDEYFASHPEFLAKLNITHILCAARESTEYKHILSSYKYLHLQISDHSMENIFYNDQRILIT